MTLSLMLVGRSGSGKTRVVETLCGSEVKNLRDVQSVTRFGLEFQAKETFGYFSDEHDLQTCTEDLSNCVNILSGIDVIGFVIRIGRFTPEERDMIEVIRDTLGERAFNFTIVIFTNLDSLIYDDVPLSEFLEESPQGLQDLLRLCGGRYVGFDNTGSEEDKQGYARSLTEAMKALEEQNESDKYTVDMLEQAMAAKFMKEDAQKKVEEDNIRLLKEKMRHDIRAEVEAKMRRELDERNIAKDIVSGRIARDHKQRQLGDGNHGEREQKDRNAEAMPYSKEQGRGQPEERPNSKKQDREQPEDMLYSKEHGERQSRKNLCTKEEGREQSENMLYTEAQGKRQSVDMLYSKDKGRGRAEDIPYSKEQGRRQHIDMPYSKEQGRGQPDDVPYSKEESRGRAEHIPYSKEQGRRQHIDMPYSKEHGRGQPDDMPYSKEESRGRAEDIPYSKEQGRRQHIDIPYSKEQGRGQPVDMLYSKEESRGRAEDIPYSREQGRRQHFDMPYSDEQGRGQPEDMPYSKDKGRGRAEDIPYSKEQGRRQHIDIPYSKEQGRGQPDDMPYSKEESKGRAEDMPYSKEQGRRKHIDMPYSDEQGRGQPEDMPYSKEEGRGRAEDMPYSKKQGKGQLEDKPYSKGQDRRQQGEMLYGLEQGRGQADDMTYLKGQDKRQPERGCEDDIEESINGTSDEDILPKSGHKKTKPKPEPKPAKSKAIGKDKIQRPADEDVLPKSGHKKHKPKPEPKPAQSKALGKDKIQSPADEDIVPKSGYKKHKPKPEPKTAQLMAKGKDKVQRPAVWVCAGCYEKNDNDDTSCRHCSQTRMIRGNSVKSSAKKQTPVPVPGKKTATVKPRIRNGVDEHEQRVVLIGKTGLGKSSTANTILGTKFFEAKTASCSVTDKCQSKRTERFGKKLLLVDTPGFFDTETSKEKIETEVKKCIGISAPGPHAFLLVMSFTNRFTKEEREVLKEVIDMFGEQMSKYLIVVFTGRDQFDMSSSIDHQIEEYITGYHEDFRSFVQKAGGGYVTFNNRGKESEKEDDAQNLLKRIDEMVKKNGGGHFTSEMFEAAEKVIQQRIANELAEKREEMRKEVEAEIREELEKEMREKYSEESSRLKELRKEDLLQYQILKRQLDKEHRKNKKDTKTEQNLKGAVRPLIIDEMRANAEKNLIQQIEKCEGPERVEVHRQLASAGQEIQQLLRKRGKMADPDASEEEGEAEDEGTQESETNEFQENADRATEKYLVELRDNERLNIENEKGALQKIKEKMSGLFSPFLSLFR